MPTYSLHSLSGYLLSPMFYAYQIVFAYTCSIGFDYLVSYACYNSIREASGPIAT